MIKKMMKNNKLLLLVAVIYVGLLIFMPDKAIKAVDNSVYYLVEMIEILPVIFLLTVAIEVLIPKEWIMKHFGENSGVLGSLLSLLLGSISAGPIYAAFPISKTLLSKGASVSNVVIILSSWAVIKIPMLANEAKFLGGSFMGIRWVLTVLSILGMAWVMGKLINKKDMILVNGDSFGSSVLVKKEYCIGCGICARLVPQVYELVDQKSIVHTENIKAAPASRLKESMDKCPTQAIVINLDESV